MNQMANELRKLPGRVMTLPRGAKIGGAVALALVALLVAAAVALGGGDAGYRYVFTKLTPEDGAASADALRAAGIPFRVEAAGDAIAVPADRVHDARLLLASQGLPRAGGVGFELFDKGDLGVSEFTQKVNLQRALEGELTRTIASMPKVREARVHITMPRKGLLRSDSDGASAAVMVRLEPGRRLDDREAAGLRHLVAAAVPDLSAERVTLVDENGDSIGNTPDSGGGAQEAAQKLERELERRVTALVEPVVGKGNVVARVTADMDMAEEDETQSSYDPDRSALRSEHKRTEQQNSSDGAQAGVAGAAANKPVPPPQNLAPARVQQKNDNVVDSTSNFEVTGTVTRRVKRVPRLVRLSVGVVVDAKDGKARSDDEIKQLTALAKHAVGFDEERGDQIEVTSAPFLREAPEPLPPAAPVGVMASLPSWAPVGAGALAALLAAAAVGVVLLRTRSRARRSREALTAGAGNQLEAGLLKAASSGAVTVSLSRPAQELGPRERARQLAEMEPQRAARVLEAWLETDIDSEDHAEVLHGR